MDGGFPRVPSQIKTALFMCLQRDPGVRVSALDLWKFMAATGDSSNNVSSSAVAQ